MNTKFNVVGTSFVSDFVNPNRYGQFEGRVEVEEDLVEIMLEFVDKVGGDADLFDQKKIKGNYLHFKQGQRKYFDVVDEDNNLFEPEPGKKYDVKIWGFIWGIDKKDTSYQCFRQKKIMILNGSESIK